MCSDSFIRTRTFSKYLLVTATPGISDLPRLGRKSQGMLARAGITSIEELRKLGSVAAYVLV